MADIRISYNCGCGFQSENIAEAVLHSDKESHSLDVVGKISKDRPRIGSPEYAATYPIINGKEG